MNIKKYAQKTASALIKTGSGSVSGIMVAAASNTPTIKLTDGVSGTAAAAVKATVVFTLTDVMQDGETITLGVGGAQKIYTFRTALSSPAQPNEVLIGASAAASLDNLKSAVNGSAGEGTTYSTGTVAHTQVTATTNTNTEQTFEAITAGTIGNTYVSTETTANGSFASATLTGGLQAIVNLVNTFTPVAGTMYDFGSDVAFGEGLYLTIGGTVDCTVFYD